MENSRQARPEIPQESISAFERTLSSICADDATSADSLVDALLDIMNSRYHAADQRRQIGETLFTALNKSRPQTIEVGSDREVIAFHRRANRVDVRVDDRLMTQLPRDDAIRLATLLHGGSAMSESRAA